MNQTQDMVTRLLVAEENDSIRVMGLLKGIAEGSPDWMKVKTIEGNPPSKARPKFTRNGRTYADPRGKALEEYTALHMRSMVDKPETGNLAVVCIFYRDSRHRIDTDNMLKHICDAANGVLWVDDVQVTAIAGISEYDPKHPRTVLALAPHVSTQARGSDSTYPCEVCGALIRRSGQPGVLTRTCSKACNMRLRGMPDLSEPIPCAFCGVAFKRRTSSQKYDSAECRIEALRETRKASSRALSNCADCGKQLTHHRGGRCRACWRIMKRAAANPAPSRRNQ